ncbi:MAG TPA: hypothetical protein P5080_06085 [Candidatus Paceibacterota bacterium]|nr:hypothetical protein [Candidatus Pacearchaeota archaeon]HRZ51509.1 hypothetical protein [Candidatus Paceibacterota bacterium]HSA37236.1 hypothetical protein [Candidatus Paceibacterota bacterium]
MKKILDYFKQNLKLSNRRSFLFVIFPLFITFVSYLIYYLAKNFNAPIITLDLPLPWFSRTQDGFLFDILLALSVIIWDVAVWKETNWRRQFYVSFVSLFFAFVFHSLLFFLVGSYELVTGSAKKGKWKKKEKIR